MEYMGECPNLSFALATDAVSFASTPCFKLRIRESSAGQFINTRNSFNRIHVAKKRRAHPFTIASRVNDAVEIENKLLKTISSLQIPTKQGQTVMYMRRSRDPDLFHEAEELVSDLEKSVGGFSVNNFKLKALLPGKWRLVLTNSTAVEKNAGSVTGLGSLPGAKCTSVDVILNKDGSARTVEGIKVFGGLIDGENSLEGKWKITGKGMLEVTYARAVLLGKTKLRADSKAVLQTSYCSQKIRLGRSASKEFYVFVRDYETV